MRDAGALAASRSGCPPHLLAEVIRTTTETVARFKVRQPGPPHLEVTPVDGAAGRIARPCQGHPDRNGRPARRADLPTWPAPAPTALPQGHRIWFGVPVGAGYWYRADFLPAGFLVTTAGDLGHYLSALLDGGRYQGRSVLSAAGVHALITPATPATLSGLQGGYGFGWYQHPIAGQQLVVDPGITPNSHADLVLVPDRHVAVAVLEDAESNLYATTFPKFDLLAMNVAAIATTGTAPRGMVEGYYLIFDLLALAALLAYSAVLARVLRSRDPGLAGRPWYRRLVTLWRELVVPFVIIVRLPDVFGEPWHTLIRGDVGLAAALVAVLGLATMAARVVFASRRPASPATPVSTPHDRDAVTLAGSRS